MKAVSYARINKCGTCKGTKQKPGSRPIICETCEGTGMESMQFGGNIIREMCDECNGTGKFVTDCMSC